LIFYYQVTKSFLNSIGIHSDNSAASLFFYYFIDGIQFNSGQENNSYYEEVKLAEIRSNLKKVYNWTKSVPITRQAAHNCSDLLIYAGMDNEIYHSFNN